MLLALDTETTGLHLKHGCRPFFISTWAEEASPIPHRSLFACPVPDHPSLQGVPGWGRNWELPVDPRTRLPDITNSERRDLVLAIRDYLEGNSVVFFNAPFDLFALATLGLYIRFGSVGGGSHQFSTLQFRKQARDKTILPPPLAIANCDELHDLAILLHARDNKRPKPPAGLKDAALYYMMLGDQDEKALHAAVVSARRKAPKLCPGAKLGIDQKGEADLNADYWLPKALRRLQKLSGGPITLPDEWDDLNAVYASRDAYRTLGGFYTVLQYLPPGVTPCSAEDTQWKGYQRQMTALPASMMMEQQGLYLIPKEADHKNPDSLLTYLNRSYRHNRERATQLCREVTADSPLYDKNLNVQSAKQLTPILFAPPPFGLGLPVLQLTATGNPATGKDALHKLVTYTQARLGGNPVRFLRNPDAAEPEPEDYLDLCGRDYAPGTDCYSQVQLAKSAALLDLLATYTRDEGFHKDNTGYKSFATGATYLRSYHAASRPLGEPFFFREWERPLSQRKGIHKARILYPSFNLVGITLTRFASRNPNGQNVSKKPQIPLRRAFGAAPGKVLVCIDYSQLELRLFAAASGDPVLSRAFAEGYDFHAFTASGMYGYAPEDTPKHLRRVAKNVNFGIVYGAGKDKIASTSGDPDAYNKYSQSFPGARSYMDNVVDSVKRLGYVETLYGYRLWVKPDPAYKGVNYIIQGTAGELVKQAMISLFYDSASPLDWDRCRIVLNVHDELIFEMDDDPAYLLKAIPQLQRMMEAASDSIGVHTPTDAGLCFDSWGGKELSFTKYKEEHDGKPPALLPLPQRRGGPRPAQAHPHRPARHAAKAHAGR